jgi:hypothetical protein
VVFPEAAFPANPRIIVATPEAISNNQIHATPRMYRKSAIRAIACHESTVLVNTKFRKSRDQDNRWPIMLDMNRA